MTDEGVEQKDTQETPSNSVKGKTRGGRGKRGRGRGDRAGIRLTSLEQEMVEWAGNGFLPGGKVGLQPAAEEKEVHVQVIPVDVRSNEDKGQDDSASRKKQKVLLLQVRSKGMGMYNNYYRNWLIDCTYCSCHV